MSKFKRNALTLSLTLGLIGPSSVDAAGWDRERFLSKAERFDTIFSLWSYALFLGALPDGIWRFLVALWFLEAPRQTSKISYPLFDVLFLTVCAVIAGAEGWEDIENFGEVHIEWLQKKGLFPNGLPVHDTIARIVSRLNPAQFQQCFVRWVQSVNKLTGGEQVAVDGKVLRGSYDRKSRCSAIHMVSAFATRNGVVMGQFKTEAKSNEITAIPALLKLLELKDVWYPLTQ